MMVMIKVTAAALATRPFLHGMSWEHLAVLSQAASDVPVPARHRFFEDGGQPPASGWFSPATRRLKSTRSRLITASIQPVGTR